MRSCPLLLSLFIYSPILPSPLSLRRERGGGAKGEYIKCERSFQYIIYILQTPFLLYTPLSCPSPSLFWERGVRGGSGGNKKWKVRKWGAGGHGGEEDSRATPIKNTGDILSMFKSDVSTSYPAIDLDVDYLTSINSWDGTLSPMSGISSIGSVMYSSHSIWLILASLILLLAIVGSIALTVDTADSRS